MRIGEITIRSYKPGDEETLWKLFYSTVRQVNIKDYTQEQVEVWAPDHYDQVKWGLKIQKLNPFIAAVGDIVIGYADLQSDGYIDHFYCHADWRGRGVGKALMKAILQKAEKTQVSRLYAHVSITARPFFERFGFEVTQQQEVNLKGQGLINYRMQKEL